MMEGAVMEYVKWFIGMVSAAFIVMMVIMMYRLNEINTFQQEVNYQIERNGGITTEAEIALNEYAVVQYGGYLSFSWDDDRPKQGVHRLNSDGDVVDAKGNVVPFSGFTLAEVEEVNGSLRTFGRGSTQARYGTPVKYILRRRVGKIDWGDPDDKGVGSFSLDPVVVGESASRVRGTGNEGRQ